MFRTTASFTVSHRVRLLCCVTVGGIAASIAAIVGMYWEFVVLSGWAATSSMFLIWTWSIIGGLDEVATAEHSGAEDETRAEAGVLLVMSSLMSLVGVGFGLFRASSAQGLVLFTETMLCVLSIALSWAVVHTVFTLRYAHQYASAKGGIDFGPQEPTYADFAYLSLTIGMTYQVSDTAVTSRIIRSTVTRQALLSYVFGTSIIAVMINVIAGIVQK